MRKMKGSIKFLSAFTLLSQLVFADTASNITPTLLETEAPLISDLSITSEQVTQTSSSGEHSTPVIAVTSVNSLEGKTDMVTNSDGLLDSTSQSSVRLSAFTLSEESENETDTVAFPTSPPLNMNTVIGTGTNTMETNNVIFRVSARTPSVTSLKRNTAGPISVAITDSVPTSLPQNMTPEMETGANIMKTNNGTFNMSSQTPSVTWLQGTTPGPVSDSPVVGTEMDNSSTALPGTTDNAGDFYTTAMGEDNQSVPMGMSPKFLTSAESGTKVGTSKVPTEATFTLTGNDTVSLGSTLTTILDDNITILPEDDITTLGDVIITSFQQPSLPSEDILSTSAVTRKTFSVVLTLSGNCKEIFKDENDDKKMFIAEVGKVLVKHFAFLEEKHIIKMDVKCGSVLVELNVEMSEKDKTEFELGMSTNFTFTYKAHTLQVVNTSIEDYIQGTTPVTTGGDGVNDDGSLNFQETLIFIVIGSVGGAFVLLSLFLLCQYLIQKIMRAGKKSFSPTEEPCIKLSEFNMAHTYIPRPQSIYSATTRSSFLPYESMEQGFGYSSASPTPYVYADGDQIREHYQEVVDKDQPITPTTKTINDFGKSGIPNWDLPVLEGVVQEGASGPASADERKALRNSTFHAPPSDGVIPPPPATSPPPPPPTVRYHPQGMSGPEGTSLKSDDGSIHTEQSSGDTRQLIKAENHDVGVDNPAMELDSAYF